MANFSKECIETFLNKQLQLFDEKVAETPQEAEEFLEDNLAVVLDSIEDVTIWMRAEWMRHSFPKMRFCRHPKCLHFRVENIL